MTSTSSASRLAWLGTVERAELDAINIQPGPSHYREAHPTMVDATIPESARPISTFEQPSQMTDAETATLKKIAQTIRRAAVEGRLKRRAAEPDTLEALIERNGRIVEALNGHSEEFLAGLLDLLRDTLETEPAVT
jgi:hypothetical protein